ncbi:MAG: FAD-dependent oxidoreductase [Verrucomicrobiota bacterium]
MTKTFDIAVVGSGTAGLAAAVTSTRAGARTLLIDSRPAAGGTGGFSGLTTLCGLYDSNGLPLNTGFPQEFSAALAETAPVKMGRVWVLPYRPERFREIAAELLAPVTTHWNTPVAVSVTGSRITSVNGFSVGAVIDCTGTAAVAQAVGAPCLATDETTQAPAVIFPLRDVTCDLSSPAAVAQAVLPLARAGFPLLNFQNNLDPKTVTVKFTGRVDQVLPAIEFLRRNVPGFERCAVIGEPIQSQRAGRMIVGRYVLTGADVLTGKKFPDAVARGAWPVEQWDAAGTARYRYLPEGKHYEIPARSLQAASIENLFMAGKTISADVDAIASARVMGVCLATGAAAGKLAILPFSR